MSRTQSTGKSGSDSRRKNLPLKITAVAAVLLVSTLFIVFPQSGPSGERPAGAGAAAPAGTGSRTTAEKPAERIALKVSDFADGKARFYFREVSGKKVKFFVLKSSDGVIRAAFDACDVCFRAKKGYKQNGDLMVCNNCGQRFPSVKINEEKGGCNPSPLERTLEGDKVIITFDALAEGLYLF